MTSPAIEQAAQVVATARLDLEEAQHAQQQAQRRGQGNGDRGDGQGVDQARDQQLPVRVFGRHRPQAFGNLKAGALAEEAEVQHGK